MVGDPKQLSDLRTIEAQVRVTCTSCRATEVWDVDALIAEVQANGGNTTWHTARYAIKCPTRCAAPMIQLLPLPFSKRRARQRRHRHAVLNLALQILREAAMRSTNHAVGTIEVRLALHVLRQFVRDQQLLNEYWRVATAEVRHPWASCYLPYRLIVRRLLELNAPVEEANRI